MNLQKIGVREVLVFGGAGLLALGGWKAWPPAGPGLFGEIMLLMGLVGPACPIQRKVEATKATTRWCSRSP